MGVNKLKDLLEKGLLFTLGAWLYLHEKADEVIKDLIEKGKVAPEEGRKFLDEFSVRVEKEKEEIKETIADLLQASFKDFGFLTKKDIVELVNRLEKLENKVAHLEKKSPK